MDGGVCPSYSTTGSTAKTSVRDWRVFKSETNVAGVVPLTRYAFGSVTFVYVTAPVAALTVAVPSAGWATSE